FTTPAAHLYEGSPNGRWGLAFFGDLTGVTLNSWSLTFTVPTEANTRTDANGDYSFTGLSAGDYTVAAIPPAGAVQTFPMGAPPGPGPVGAGQTVTDITCGMPWPAAPAGTQQPNLAVTTDAKVQQMPSIAVDPTNANHLVMAYMDYSLRTTGYAGLAVANSTN